MNRHCIRCCTWTQSWDTSDSIFSAAILAAILENMQLLLLISTYSYSTTFTLYESTLLFVSVFERRAELHQIVIFVDHLGHHLGNNATDVFDFYIFILYDLHFIWIDTLFVSVFEMRAEIHSIQNFGGHLSRHLEKYATDVTYSYSNIFRPLAKTNTHKFFFSNRIISVWNSLPAPVVLSRSTLSFKRNLKSINLDKYLIFHSIYE